MATSLHASAKASSFAESAIREMTRVALAHDAINLAQGFPDFPAPAAVKQAAAVAIAEDHNQYPITWGVPAFREAIAAMYARDWAIDVDAETELVVTCGATEAMSASFLGLLDPGDEVVVFEPFYEYKVRFPSLGMRELLPFAEEEELQLLRLSPCTHLRTRTDEHVNAL